MHCILKYTQVLDSTKYFSSIGAKTKNLGGYMKVSK